MGFSQRDYFETTYKRVYNTIVYSCHASYLIVPMMRGDLFLYWVPVVTCMVCIFVISSVPGDELASSVTLVSGQTNLSLKLAVGHVVEFGTLSICCYRAFKRLDYTIFRTCLYTMALTVSFGICDEMRQMFVPGRVPAMVDILYDSLGATIGMVFGGLFPRFYSHMRKTATELFLD